MFPDVLAAGPFSLREGEVSQVPLVTRARLQAGPLGHKDLAASRSLGHEGLATRARGCVRGWLGGSLPLCPLLPPTLPMLDLSADPHARPWTHAAANVALCA